MKFISYCCFLLFLVSHIGQLLEYPIIAFHIIIIWYAKSVKVIMGGTRSLTPTESISLNCASKTIDAGKTFTLKANIMPKEAANKDVKCTSSNPNVATVAANGRVKRVKSK